MVISMHLLVVMKIAMHLVVAMVISMPLLDVRDAPMAIFLLIVHIIGNFVKVSVLTVIMLKILNLIRLVVELLSCSCGVGISCGWILVVFLNNVWTLKKQTVTVDIIH